jgi:hypothetical protein
MVRLLEYILITIIPSIALQIRRLHDIGKSAWMILIVLIPLIGSLWLYILNFKDSDSIENKYGPNPKDVETHETPVIEELILSMIIWMLISRVYWKMIPYTENFSYDSLSHIIAVNYSTLLWGIFPLLFAFTVKSRSKQIIIFIFGGLLLLVALFDIWNSLISRYI